MHNDIEDYDAIIIGAGFSGLYALYHLREKMGLKVRVFDGASGVGGTWWHNRYPGARVDAPSTPFYGYTFSEELVEEWDWSETQSAQPEVLAYLEHFAKRFNLNKDIQFESWVTDAHYNEATQSWTIKTDKGEETRAQFLICATGALFIANKPDYPGIDEFKGDCFHTGRWPHEEVSFKGKRVGVIGTGSSGIQAIPEIAKEADHLTVFQRTPQYALPARNREITRQEMQLARDNWEDHRLSMINHGGYPHKLFPRDYEEDDFETRQLRYEELWDQGGMELIFGGYTGVLTHKALNEEVGNFVKGKIAETVKDHETAQKLMPNYHFATKRLILDNGYFETYNRENVSLVDLRNDPIERFTEQGIVTQNAVHDIDIVVLATGFDAVSGSMLKLNPKGRGGISLKEKWQERFDTYLGTTISGFPNMFMIHGPGSPGVFYAMPLGSERTIDWIEGCITHQRENGLNAMEATKSAETAWDHEIQTIASKTLYVETESWYLGANIPGKPRQFLGHLIGSQYFMRLNEIAEKDFEGFVFEKAV